MVGHILCIDTDANPKIVLSWTPEGKRRRGRPKEKWRRTACKKEDRWGGIPVAKQIIELKREWAGEQQMWPYVPYGTNRKNNNAAKALL